MTIKLHPEMLSPTAYLARHVVTGLGCVLLASAAFVAGRSATVGSPQRVTSQTARVVSVAVPFTVPVSVAVVPAPPPPVDDVGLVFTTADATYLTLAHLRAIDGDAPVEATPRHATPRLSEQDYVYAATAEVLAEDVPLAHRGWLGAQVVVDGTCTTKVTGFAVVARLTGDPDYAGLEIERWTAGAVMANGVAELVGKLEGCAGGSFARAATQPAIIVAATLDDPSLAATATARALSSAAAVTAQRSWREDGQPGTWTTADGTALTTRVVRHPVTGTTWVSVHARYEGGCGLPELVVWKLYRKDADGTLVETPVALGELTEIDQLVDLDGDGELEVVGRRWAGLSRAINHRDGTPIATLPLQFFGCGC